MGDRAHVGSRLCTAHRQVRGVGSTLKVLDLTEFYSPQGGGVRTYLHQKIAWIATRADFEHVAVVPAHRSDTRRVERTVVHEIGGPGAPASPGYHVLWNLQALTRILRRERPDVIELGSPYLAPWLLAWAKRHLPCRIVGFLHMDIPGAARRGLPSGVRALAGGGAAMYARLAYQGCDRLIAASETMAGAARDAGLREPTLVPLGVDLDLFSPGKRDEVWRRRHVGKANGPLGLYVGRLAGEKDLDVLVRAIPALHQRTGMKVVFVGEGRLRARLHAMQSAAPESVEVLGFESDRERLATAYASADLFFAPCTHETFGLAVLEAAASGTPVVGSSQGGVGEMLDGVPWGATFGPADPEALVRAAESVLGRERESLRVEARRFAEGYSWNRTFERLTTIYRELSG